jgi:hypothetical protein
MGEEVFHASFTGREDPCEVVGSLLTLLSMLLLCSSALDSDDDLLYLKEQMEAEEDAERLLCRTEKRAFAAFKISLSLLNINDLAFLVIHTVKDTI